MRIFLACIAIGVAAIVGVNSLARSLQDGLAREGRKLVGGDAVVLADSSRVERPRSARFSPRAAALDDIATMRAMARNAAGDATLADLKAVGPDWPPLGAAEFAPAASRLRRRSARRGDASAPSVDDVLLDRLSLKVGDDFDLGDARSRHPRPASSPSRTGSAPAIGFGARVLISHAALAASGLVQPGSLIRWTTRVTDEPAGPPPPATPTCWR